MYIYIYDKEFPDRNTCTLPLIIVFLTFHLHIIAIFQNIVKYCICLNVVKIIDVESSCIIHELNSDTICVGSVSSI